MFEEIADQPPPGEDPLLTVAEAAARTGMRPASWRSGVARGHLPPPDDPDVEAPRERRRPRWRLSTVTGLRRPGAGYRTDLVTGRKQRQHEMAADLAQPAPVPTGALTRWLQANHQTLLAVAETLVDHRDSLLAGTPDQRVRDDLAAAIDQGGEQMLATPTLRLASAVTYALFLLRPGGGVRVPADAGQVLTRHARLHDEFARVRPER